MGSSKPSTKAVPSTYSTWERTHTGRYTVNKTHKFKHFLPTLTVHLFSDTSSEGVRGEMQGMDASIQQALTSTPTHTYIPAAGVCCQQVCYSHLELWEWNCHHNLIGALLPCACVGVCFCVGTHMVPFLHFQVAVWKKAALQTRQSWQMKKVIFLSNRFFHSHQTASTDSHPSN